MEEKTEKKENNYKRQGDGGGGGGGGGKGKERRISWGRCSRGKRNKMQKRRIENG